MKKTNSSEEHMENAAEMKQDKKPSYCQRFKILGVALIVILLAILLIPKIANSTKSKTEVIVSSALEKIVDISELSTFTTTYNGIVPVMNEKKTEKIDYYVAYEAKVNAGIDFSKIDFFVDDATKIIHIDIPDVYITDVNVDISSLDFIFYNKDDNTSSVTQEAYKACEEDAKKESQQEDAIITLAQQNAENVLTALTRPLIEQLDSKYTLEID